MNSVKTQNAAPTFTSHLLLQRTRINLINFVYTFLLHWIVKNNRGLAANAVLLNLSLIKI